jgi:hypothetical protein
VHLVAGLDALRGHDPSNQARGVDFSPNNHGIQVHCIVLCHGGFRALVHNPDAEGYRVRKANFTGVRLKFYNANETQLRVHLDRGCLCSTMLTMVRPAPFLTPPPTAASASSNAEDGVCSTLPTRRSTLNLYQTARILVSIASVPVSAEMPKWGMETMVPSAP